VIIWIYHLIILSDYLMNLLISCNAYRSIEWVSYGLVCIYIFLDWLVNYLYVYDAYFHGITGSNNPWYINIGVEYELIFSIICGNQYPLNDIIPPNILLYYKPISILIHPP